MALLDDPVAQALLRSTVPARLEYTWLDGTPRVVPIWFHRDGRDVVMGTPPNAPKLKALGPNPRVALTIDGNEWPYKVLLLRGEARVELVEGVVPEYAAAARPYFGEERGRAWAEQMATMVSSMARIAVRPAWAAILDFETRFPSALSSSPSHLSRSRSRGLW